MGVKLTYGSSDLRVTSLTRFGITSLPPKIRRNGPGANGPFTWILIS
jgi:hypothetical protein